MPLFLVTKHDTIIQATGYLVRADDAEKAKESVTQGFYIEETATVTLDTLTSEDVDVTEISEYGTGQERNAG
jgi:hypothetical protein